MNTTQMITALVDRGFTKKDIAQSLGMCQQSIYKWLQGQSPSSHSLKRLKKLCKSNEICVVGKLKQVSKEQDASQDVLMLKGNHLQEQNIEALKVTRKELFVAMKAYFELEHNESIETRLGFILCTMKRFWGVK
jgi:transcriptional regulator with XRE-family HTH domain